jgi:propanediol dehydratase small subunit
MTVKEMIINEITKLPEDMLPEIYDFVRFLEIRRDRETLVRASQKLSEESFAKVWDNESDSVYDTV